MDNQDKDKKLKIFLPILLLVSAAIWLPTISGKSSKPGNAPGNEAKETFEVGELMTMFAKARQEPLQSRSRFSDWGRDPFAGSGKQQRKAVEPEQLQSNSDNGPSSELVLRGIFWNDQKPAALINDRVVGVGSEVDGYVVSEIDKKKVVISDKSGKFELLLPQ